MTDGRTDATDWFTFPANAVGNQCSRRSFNHSSASPVLTATGFKLLMGKGNFRPPTESTPLNRFPKISDRWLRRRLLQLYQIRCTSVHGGFWAHGLKYKQNYFYLCLFWELTHRSDPSTDFHAWWLKRRGLAQGCVPFGVYLYGSPFRGQTLKTTFLGRE